MSLAHSHELNGGREAGKTGRPRSGTSERQRILAAVDGSEQTNPVLEYILGLADKSAVEVIVLNVQPEPEDWRLRGYGSFKRDEIRSRLIEDRGQPVVNDAARKLEKAGIKHEKRIVIGDAAVETVRLAEKEGCDVIILGEPKAGGLSRWLSRMAGISLGSLANRVVQLAETPVVIVK